MKGFTSLLAASALAMTLTGCAPPDTHDADVKAIQDTEVQWNKDFAAKDVDKLAAHYTDDAVLMMGGPAMTTRSATIAGLKALTSDPAFSVTFHATTVEVAKSGDVGYTQGLYTMTMTDPATKKVMTDHGGYLTVYRKQTDGSWKSVEDTTSSYATPSVPIPPPVVVKKK